MRRNLLLLLLWLAGLLAVDAQTLSRKEVETYVINQYGKRWKDIALYLGEKDTLDKDNALTFEKTISVRGKSKNELFVDLNYWFLKTFSNASSSIEMADKELGVIMAKGYLPGIRHRYGIRSRLRHTVWHTRSGESSTQSLTSDTRIYVSGKILRHCHQEAKGKKYN